MGQGQVYGAEIEIRKSLDFVSPRLSAFSISSNVTYVKSFITMSDTEFNSRKSFEKDGETISNKRNMAGQAPFIINAGLAFQDPDIGLETGFYYNVQAKTLLIVGTGLYPDVYSVPFHSLKFSLNKSLGAAKKSTLTFGVSNILNDVKEEVYTSFGADNQLFTRYSPGIEVSLGIKYAF